MSAGETRLASRVHVAPPDWVPPAKSPFMTRFAIIALFCAPLFAQWPSYPPNKPDMNGPPPKAADGHPDLSGVWDRGMPPVKGQQPFTNLPSMLEGGLPLQPWAAELRRQRLEQNSREHPDAHCLPLHPVQLHSHPQPRKIIQTPNEVLIIYEANDGLRQIFTDGRPLPTDPEPWWFGYSVGKWDGDTLVVNSIGFRDMSWIDEQGTPMREGGKLIERFRRPNFGTLEIEITVDDPQTFTKPWTVELTQHLMPNTELIEFVCAENNRSLPHLVGKQ
jgi:hypothetical protein